MENLPRIAIQWLHVVSGVLWIGGGIFGAFVLLPSLSAMPAAARGPAFATIAPRQIRYILRVAELTIATGIANLLVTGRARQLEDPTGSRWAMVMILGIVLALALYGIVRGMVAPAISRMLTVGPRAAGGDAAAVDEANRIRERVRRISYAQVAIGLTILLLMVAARFS